MKASRSGRMVWALAAGAVFLGGGVIGSCATGGSSQRAVANPTSSTAGPTRVADVFATMSEDELAYLDHIITLSNVYFEGRSADTRGAKRAGEYLAHHFSRIGLEPAFDTGESVAMGGAMMRTMAFEQTFDVPGDLEVLAAGVEVKSHQRTNVLEEDEDFTVMGFTGTGDAEGELAFVGYSIEEGEGGYSSYNEGDDLTGKIAIILRFEPMDAAGKSKWAKFGRWSGKASLAGKVKAAATRGAAGVILVNAPGADDPRARRLSGTNATRFDAGLEIPAVMLSAKAADEMIQAADPEGRSLMDLRRLADSDEPGGAQSLSAHGVRVALSAGVQRKQYETANIGAVLPGKGDLADEWIIVGGHYDHLGYGYLGSSRTPSRVGEVHRGADDNASGAAGVLLIASQLKQAYDQMGDNADARSVLFLQFGGEEMGLLGSKHYVENTSLEASRVNAMLNLDMIGRVKDNSIEVYGTGTAETMQATLEPHFARSGFSVKQHKSGVGPSDHTSFYRAGIPALHFFSGLHSEYHSPDDVPWLINVRDSVRMTNLISAIAQDMATSDDRFAHVPAPASTGSGRRMSGMKVRLGIAPGSYGEEGKGVAVGEVFPDTSAAKGGILPGDVIIRWNGEELPTVMAMMEQLASHEPGDVARIVVNRDGQEVDLLVTLLAREEGG